MDNILVTPPPEAGGKLGSGSPPLSGDSGLIVWATASVRNSLWVLA